MDFNLYLTAYIKISSKCIIGLNVKSKTIKLLQETIWKKNKKNFELGLGTKITILKEKMIIKINQNFKTLLFERQH